MQLYTVRAEMERDLPGTLARVAEIGYQEVEFAGYFRRTPAQIRELLATHRLRSPSTHIDFNTFSSGWDAVLTSAREIGHSFVTVPSLPNSARSSRAALKETAAAFNRAGAEAKSAGLRVAFHNHNIEFTPVDGVEPFTVLLEETDPALVSFQLDVYWAFRAGRDPLALLKAHPQRYSMLHIKGFRGSARAPRWSMSVKASSTGRPSSRTVARRDSSITSSNTIVRPTRWRRFGRALRT